MTRQQTEFKFKYILENITKLLTMETDEDDLSHVAGVMTDEDDLSHAAGVMT